MSFSAITKGIADELQYLAEIAALGIDGFDRRSIFLQRIVGIELLSVGWSRQKDERE
jgi:hypothetical protein